MKLTQAQKKFLRGRGHSLKPVITVADAGVSDSLLREFDSTIDHHELIKVRFRAADRERRDQLIEELCARGSARLISRTGNVVLLYRRDEAKPRIALPAT